MNKYTDQYYDTPYPIAPPAGWRDDGPDAWGKLPAPTRPRYSPLSRSEDADELFEFYGEDQCTPSRRTRLTAQPQAAPKPIVYAQYDPAFDPDLHPLPLPAAKPEPAQTVPVQPLPSDDPADGELPPGLTPAAWLAQRHVVSVTRKAVAEAASVSHVPVEEEEPQLVITPAGFRYADRFSWLEIK